MMAYAAIDLRGGRVVQLVGGNVEDERISLADPRAVAQRWIDAGFRALHVVDLDAALGIGSNAGHVEQIVSEAGVPVQVGGGVRDRARMDALLDAGAAAVVVGTRAVEDRAWLERAAASAPGRIVVAADIRDGRVLSRGWTAETGLGAEEFLAGLEPLPLAAVLVTDVGREGRMNGVDGDRMADLCAATRHPLIASGGVADEHDLRRLAAAGAAGVVLGMALYSGALDARRTAGSYAA